MGTCRNKKKRKSPILFFFFLLVTFVNKNGKREITKKEKLLSIKDLYFLILSNSYSLPDYRSETEGACLGLAEKQFVLPFFLEKAISPPIEY